MVFLGKINNQKCHEFTNFRNLKKYFKEVMKKQYINPNVYVAGPEFDLELMIPVGSKPVDDGFVKDRDSFDDNYEDEEIIEELQQMENDQKHLW